MVHRYVFTSLLLATLCLNLSVTYANSSIAKRPRQKLEIVGITTHTYATAADRASNSEKNTTLSVSDELDEADGYIPILAANQKNPKISGPSKVKRSQILLDPEKKSECFLNRCGVAPNLLLINTEVVEPPPASSPRLYTYRFQDNQMIRAEEELSETHDSVLVIEENGTQSIQAPFSHEKVSFFEESPCFNSCSVDFYDDSPKEQSISCACRGWCTRIGIEYTGGQGVGVDNGFASANALIVPELPTPYPLSTFVDGWGHALDNGHWGGNLGLGARYYDACYDVVIGGNIYYDFLDGTYGHYNQIGIGAEVLSSYVDFRMNGYFPVGCRKESGTTHRFNEESGNCVTVCCFETALPGCDFEFGRCLWRYTPCNFPQLELYGGLGGYYFSTQSCKDAIGGQARIEARIGDYLHFALSGTTDQIYHQRFQMQIGISVPFGCCSGSYSLCTESPAYRGAACRTVNRRRLIAIDRRRCCMIQAVASPGTK